MAAALLLLASLAIGQPGKGNGDVVTFNTDPPKSLPSPKLADREKCYGISKAQENDGTAGCDDCAGTARRDYMPNTWKHVPQGTCEAAGGKLIPGKPLPEDQ